MPRQSEITLTKKGKEEIQAGTKVAVATYPETQTVTVRIHPPRNPETRQKGKGKGRS